VGEQETQTADVRDSAQATLVTRDLTSRVFAITRFRGRKAVRKLNSNFAVTVYGGGVTVWRAHQLVTSSITCFSSRVAAQTALGILRACYV
jgi:hypothetical protein